LKASTPESSVLCLGSDFFSGTFLSSFFFNLFNPANNAFVLTPLCCEGGAADLGSGGPDLGGGTARPLVRRLAGGFAFGGFPFGGGPLPAGGFAFRGGFPFLFFGAGGGATGAESTTSSSCIRLGGGPFPDFRRGLFGGSFFSTRNELGLCGEDLGVGGFRLGGTLLLDERLVGGGTFFEGVFNSFFELELGGNVFFGGSAIPEDGGAFGFFPPTNFFFAGGSSFFSGFFGGAFVFFGGRAIPEDGGAFGFFPPGSFFFARGSSFFVEANGAAPGFGGGLLSDFTNPFFDFGGGAFFLAGGIDFGPTGIFTEEFEAAGGVFRWFRTLSIVSAFF